MTVLITGASSGFGHLLARRLAAAGQTAFGGARRTAEPADGFPLLPLDVRDEASVRAAVATVEREAGSIDVLVNNAGYSHEGALEELTVEELKAIFETNFFGAVRMMQAVLPGMRARRAGRIINVSSLAGLMPLPFMGAYSASKHALESYSESLRHELLPLGISVFLVEPGYFKTGIAQRKLRVPPRIADYDAQRQRVYAAFEHEEQRAPAPDPVVDLLLELVAGRRTRLRHLIGRDSSMFTLRGIVPQRVYEWGMRKSFRLD
jgi:NAD(P)-dependent dehydrogenase (short-subunit alcohol dehydrogenase family)